MFFIKEEYMNKTNSILLSLGVCLVFFSSACQNNQTSSNSPTQNKTETISKENTAPTAASKNNLTVTEEFWKQQMDKAMAKRDAPIGIDPEGLKVPPGLIGGGIVKQRQKIAEMIANGYAQPLDFADLAEKRKSGDLLELPMATETYILAVGGTAGESEFSSYSFKDGSALLKPDSPKFMILKNLSDNFESAKYDLNNPKDRKQIRIRLLRMINAQTQKVLEEIADSYQKKFNRPLKISSMTRSMDYQIELNGVDNNSFKVRDDTSTPPHLSGCAFDIARTPMTAEEQNFMMEKLNQMEVDGKLDALIESGSTPVFHVFVYQDGKPPKM